ncbi:putative nucleotidyltransferase substrate binding domain-containing protein [Aneurinibacillus tyrosinisolvens]|uniref:putative nucleotidyltransferase substrate binding domain-containing protein n=1 Tax=Aneurinibacillus tyrosinisolvens TaxID=1443435 RepID=UPI00063F75F2|nr:putative nucleotidyltransferase substrate binding domain-containing protein [Aneurinibacillus tyrosinisolvens]
MNDNKHWGVFLSEVTGAKSLNELKKIHSSFPYFLQSVLRNSQPDIHEIYVFLNRIHDALMQKALQYAERAVKDEGYTSPPEVYCWIITGSGGRKEQTAWTDQDNGIIYRCSPCQNPQEAEAFVKRFAEIGVCSLKQVGYPLCPGNVMATNARWCKSEIEWELMIRGWGENHSAQDLRFLLILSDFRVLYGDGTLAGTLRGFFSSFVRSRPSLLHRFAEHAIAHPIPLNILGQIIPERWGEHSGMFDIKHGIYIQLVNSIRFWALAYSIEETSTLERIKRLEEKGVWTDQEGKTLKSAFSYVARLRLSHHLTQEKHKELLDHHIYLTELKKQELTDLKKAMRAAKQVQSKIKREFISPNNGSAKGVLR